MLSKKPTGGEEAHVSLPEALTLDVRANRTGIPAERERPGGPGIRLMRASAIGAGLTIGAAEGGGTLVRCTIPQEPAHG